MIVLPSKAGNGVGWNVVPSLSEVKSVRRAWLIVLLAWAGAEYEVIHWNWAVICLISGPENHGSCLSAFQVSSHNERGWERRTYINPRT
jgi:hypothetical protein